MIRLFLDNGFDCNKLANLLTLFIKISQPGQSQLTIDILRLLVSKLSTLRKNELDHLGNSVLVYCMEYDMYKCVPVLFRAGVNIEDSSVFEGKRKRVGEYVHSVIRNLKEKR